MKRGSGERGKKHAGMLSKLKRNGLKCQTCKGHINTSERRNPIIPRGRIMKKRVKALVSLDPSGNEMDFVELPDRFR